MSGAAGGAKIGDSREPASGPFVYVSDYLKCEQAMTRFPKRPKPNQFPQRGLGFGPFNPQNQRFTS